MGKGYCWALILYPLAETGDSEEFKGSQGHNCTLTMQQCKCSSVLDN